MDHVLELTGFDVNASPDTGLRRMAGKKSAGNRFFREGYRATVGCETLGDLATVAPDAIKQRPEPGRAPFGGRCPFPQLERRSVPNVLWMPAREIRHPERLEVPVESHDGSLHDGQGYRRPLIAPRARGLLALIPKKFLRPNSLVAGPVTASGVSPSSRLPSPSGAQSLRAGTPGPPRHPPPALRSTLETNFGSRLGRVSRGTFEGREIVSAARPARHGDQPLP